MNASVQALKDGVDFRQIVERSCPLNRSSKVHCPFHEETHPSCHIYPDGYKCFGCGAYGDHLQWLAAVEGLSTRDALELLRALSGLPYRARSHPAKREAVTSFYPIDRAAYTYYAERLRATLKLPGALEGRGILLEDALQLGFAADGEDALLPINGPTGDILALKRRFHRPRSEQRYSYVTPGHGSPAWCSPGFGNAADILIVEGELNGALAYLALHEAGSDAGVMGVAGVYAPLHEEALKGKTLYLWTDADAPGRAALRRWLAQTRPLAAKVRALPPRSEDACDIAGTQGRLYLASWLLETMHARRTRRRAGKKTRKRELAWTA